jgi:two-component system LytT family response regulator
MQRPIDTIVVEDEPLAQERIRGYMAKLPFLRLLGVFDNGVDALVFLQTARVDLIFLDINLGDFSGIQLLESMKIGSQVVISSAYDEYALKGFELNVTDYLLKPYTFDRWVQAVDRVRGNLERGGGLGVGMAAPAGGSGVSLARQVGGLEGGADRRWLFVRAEHRLEKLFFDELLYIEGRRDYRRIQAMGRSIMTLSTFVDLEQAIPAGVAVRVHKSYMVALSKIDTVEKDVVRIGEVTIPVSDTYRKAFLQAIGFSNANGH